MNMAVEVRIPIRVHQVSTDTVAPFIRTILGQEPGTEPLERFRLKRRKAFQG